MPPGTLIQPLSPPLSGQKTDVVPPLVPDGFLWQTQNVVPRFGELITRPGFQNTGTTTLNGRVTGGLFFTKIDGTTQVNVAATLTKWYKMTGTTWTDITPATQLTGTADNPTRFTVFPTSGVNTLVGTNNVDTPKRWDGTAAAFVDVGGTPPVARDLTAAANHVILFNVVEAGIRSPSRLRISDFNDPNTWPAANTIDLTDTDDNGVGVMALGRTGFIAYKDNSVWQGFPQSGATPYRVELMEIKPGPVSPAAIVSTGSTHYYLGRDARVYRVTGLAVEAVSEPVDKDLQAKFALTQKMRAWGVYRRLDRTVWFFFPGIGKGDPDTAVSYFPETGALFLHTIPFSVSAGWQGDDLPTVTWDSLGTYTWANVSNTYPTWDSFGGTQRPVSFIGTVSGLVHRFFYGLDDAGTAIPIQFDFPFRAYGGVDQTQTIDAIESSFEVTAGGPLVTVSVAATDALAEVDFAPSYSALGTHNTTLSTRQVLKTLDAGLIVVGRFVAVRYAATSSKTVKFRGSVLRGWTQPIGN